MNPSPADLKSFLREIGGRVLEELKSSSFIERLPEGPIKDRILDYSIRGGKYLRPGLMCAATGVVGGNIDNALPFAVAVEMFHTWTLVHDDIIDRDRFRRGGMTMHSRIESDFQHWPQRNPSVPLEHLAHSLALLIGDAQHGLVMDIMTRAGLNGAADPQLTLALIAELEGEVLPALMTGEVTDILQTGISLEEITAEDIEKMLRRKTGALITYCVTAGGMIGLGTGHRNHQWIQALRQYGDNLGLAFQLRDDVLGILGDQDKLGKPIGSDFREGKRTLAVKFAYDSANAETREIFHRLLGKPDLTDLEVDHLRRLVMDTGGVAAVEKWSESLIADALKSLSVLPECVYREILSEVARFTIRRNT